MSLLRRRQGPTFDPPAETERHTVRGPDPWMTQAVAALDVHQGVLMAGLNGAYRGGAGSKLTGGTAFSGDLGPLQNFARGHFQGAAGAKSQRSAMNVGQLPSPGTGVPPALAALVANGGGGAENV